MSSNNNVQMLPKSPVYTVGRNSEGFDYVSGPGEGLCYHSHSLFSQLSCKSEREAKRLVPFAEYSFFAGVQVARAEIHVALGLITACTKNNDSDMTFDVIQDAGVWGLNDTYNEFVAFACKDDAVRASSVMKIAFSEGQNAMRLMLRGVLNKGRGTFEKYTT
jgi:hypothetical protein